MTVMGVGVLGIRKESVRQCPIVRRSILSALHASNRWDWTEPRGEVAGLLAALERWLWARWVVKGARIASVSHWHGPHL